MKRLYPKTKSHKSKPRRARPSKSNPLIKPYHVYYEDSNQQIEPEWKHYSSELAVKADAWYRCRLLGFHNKATLFDKKEFESAAARGTS